MPGKLIASACGLALAAMISPAVAQEETGAGDATGQTGDAGKQQSAGTTDQGGAQDQQTTGTADQATGAGGGAAAQADTGGDPRQSATQQAEQLGMQGVREVQGAFVLEGTSPTATPIFMIVGPNGELLALAAPIAPSGQAGTPTGATEGQATGDTPEAGEPAQSGYMATQTQPASPNMWDPAMVEGAMQRLELGAGGVAGEVPAQQ